MRKLHSIALAFLFTTLLFSCMSTKKFVSKEELNTASVPPGYNPKKHILLVAAMPQAHNRSKRSEDVTKKLDKALQQYFPYRYEIVSLSDIQGNDKKYSDTSVYRYALLNNLSMFDHSSTVYNQGNPAMSTSATATSVVIGFSFYDRTTKTKYHGTGGNASFIKYPVATLSALVAKATSQKQAHGKIIGENGK